MNSPTLFRSRLLLCLVSGLLLTLSFPPFYTGYFAWIALIPFFYAIMLCHRKREAVWFGFFTGLVFFGFSLSWIHNVHLFALLGLIPLEASFFMLLGWGIYLGRYIDRIPFRLLWVGAAWTSVEVLRSEFPIFGLGWNLLGYSQSSYLPVIQFANLFGAYGLGFVIAVVNAVIFRLLLEWSWQAGHGKMGLFFQRLFSVDALRRTALFFSLVIIIVGGVLIYGYQGLKNDDFGGKPLHLSVIQGNIPQEIKWNPSVKSGILQGYTKLTEDAAKENPDLIIWPEAAFPGYFNRDENAQRIQELVYRIGIPTLIGSPHFAPPNQIYNSAYLLDERGSVHARYDKQYLVPFGEYVPLKPIFGWLTPLAYSLGISDFSAGQMPVVFNVEEKKFRFSTLICFEDVFPNIARTLVKRGADLLTVITNDAWFGVSAAPYQHLQASIFRAIENGVPVVRAANTGVSAFISRKGKVLARVQEQGEDLFVTGHKTYWVETGAQPTFYQKGGWIFPYFILFVFVYMLITYEYLRRTQRKRKVKKKLKTKGKKLKRGAHGQHIAVKKHRRKKEAPKKKTKPKAKPKSKKSSSKSHKIHREH